MSSTLFADRRRRNLAILSGFAVLAILLATLGVWHQASFSAQRQHPELFFPDLVSRLRQVAHIRVRSKTGTVDVVFKPEKTWVVASKDDYPASYEQVKGTVVALATLTKLEPKTDRADWLPYVNLDSPAARGNGKEITLLDDKGGVIASIIIGKSEDIGDPEGAIGLFVRRPDESQSWLARSAVDPKSDLSDWLEKQVMAVDRARIAEADVDPLSGPSYVVRRDKPTDTDFKLADMPKGRELSYDAAPDGVAAAVVDFSFDDVKPARDFDFSDAAHSARVVTKTFDGLTVTVNVIQQGADYWATVSADGSTPEGRNEARQINARATGWAYKLPPYKGAQFTATLESILKPKGGTTPAAAQPAH
ncbi:MAG TPA: DUF4340 domain-containing protein [Rhizomicrobium sp.]|nr:DUF4340 domain-containing protein [Rhizomicrobium sp.]